MPVTLRVLILLAAGGWLVFGAARDLRAGTVVVRGLPLGAGPARVIAALRALCGLIAFGLALRLVTSGGS